jgi:ribosomal-protein-serine acetyltransferase
MLLFVRKNLIMRSLSLNDAAEVYATVDGNRDYLRKWLPWVDATDTPAVIENVIASWEKDFENKQEIVLGIFENGKYVGNIGLHDLKRSNRSGMMGYWLEQKHQGRGIITDCVQALTSFGFYTFGLNRIYIHCAAANTKSRAIPERLNFVREGTLQDGEYLYGTFHDMIIYGMVKRNWQKRGVLCLLLPAREHKEAALEYKREHMDYNEDWIHGSGGLMKADDYNTWFNNVTNLRYTAPENWVKCTTYFAMVDGEIIGTIQIRHTLNDALLLNGGHIGYGVRPTERRKGYGVKMLSLALEKCRELGIEKVLVTCDKDNPASAKTILRNGGIFENEIIEDNGNILQRYWISIS